MSNGRQVSLVIMAAGLGSRYGGDKQVDGIGPHNEILMEYSICDALRAGFGKVVFIVKPEMAEMVEGLCGGYLRRKTALDGRPVEVAFACQDFSSIPDFYTIPAERSRPFGTVHALLCAESCVQGPCCVINADDYYGADAYRTMYRALNTLPETGRAAMVGYLLKNTASLHGSVSRGVCTMEDGRLRAIHETKKIQLCAGGSLRDLTADRLLNPEAVVSMNFWGFMPSIFPALHRYFEDFLRDLLQARREGREDLAAECLLPVMVDYLIRTGALEVDVLRSADRWFGMTYQEDRALVAGELRRLHEEGVYPESLRT